MIKVTDIFGARYNPDVSGSTIKTLDANAAKSSQDFLRDMMTAPVALGFPDDGVMKKYAAPLAPLAGGLVEKAIPQNCLVPAVPVVSDEECARLASPANGFFQNVLRPTIKHV